MSSHEDRRLIRLQKIKRTIVQAKEKGKQVDKEKLIAVCAMEWGASRRTILEYIKTVELTL